MEIHPKKPIVLIGPVCDDPAESVSAVNSAFIEGLGGSYKFVAPKFSRRYGFAGQSRLNLWNLYYFCKHTAIWVWNLFRHRPAVAHYAVSSGWALGKGLFLLRLARLMGAKTVGHLHAGDIITYWNGLPSFRRRLAARQLRRLDAFIVLSESWRKIIIEQLGIPSENLFVVNNPIAREFEEGALQMAISRPCVSFLALGVMGRDKGVFEILDAAELVYKKRLDLVIQLAGPERDPGILAEIKAQIEKRSLVACVKVLPTVWGAAKVELFRNTSIFLLPSYYENFPLVVLEAAAAGQAIISTPVGATPEFFEDGISAVFVSPQNTQQLADAMIRLLENPDERNRLAAAARKTFIDRLGRSEILRSLENVYAHLLREKSHDCRKTMLSSETF